MPRGFAGPRRAGTGRSAASVSQRYYLHIASKPAGCSPPCTADPASRLVARPAARPAAARPAVNSGLMDRMAALMGLDSTADQAASQHQSTGSSYEAAFTPLLPRAHAYGPGAASEGTSAVDGGCIEAVTQTNTMSSGHSGELPASGALPARQPLSAAAADESFSPMRSSDDGTEIPADGWSGAQSGLDGAGQSDVEEEAQSWLSVSPSDDELEDTGTLPELEGTPPRTSTER